MGSYLVKEMVKQDSGVHKDDKDDKDAYYQGITNKMTPREILESGLIALVAEQKKEGMKKGMTKIRMDSNSDSNKSGRDHSR
ncbi:MAG: hypothetical protein QNK11_07850 [Legionella sp.]|nr:hypothetical protein [Legionella sp.]